MLLHRTPGPRSRARRSPFHAGHDVEGAAWTTFFELANRTGVDAWDLITDLGATDEEAKTVLEVLDELEAPVHAHELANEMRRQGHTL